MGGDTLGRLLPQVDPDGTLVMFGNSSDQVTTFNVREVYNDGLRRYQGFELFHRYEPFGRDLRVLLRLVAEGRLVVQVTGELPWEEMAQALEQLGDRSVAGELVLTVGRRRRLGRPPTAAGHGKPVVLEFGGSCGSGVSQR